MRYMRSQPKRPMRGVNLGGWLVLEPWITPSLFVGTDAEDEYGYADTAGPERMRQLRHHRQTFITKQDFEWLAAQGIEAVRIPVGYWIFGDASPYIGALDYLDKAFVWAEASGIRILLCLHGASGSQNGKVHSGQQGAVGWLSPEAPQYVEESLRVISQLAQRYTNYAALLGIELLNEPSCDIPRSVLNRYYRRAYRVIRRELGSNVWVVLNDGYQPERWQWTLHGPFYRRTYQDVHCYQAFTIEDKALDIDGHLAKLAGSVRRQLRHLTRHRRIVIGEWSAALDPQSLRGLSAAEQTEAYKQYVEAQLAVFRSADAWFFWTYKTESSLPWSFRQLCEARIFPDQKDEL